MFTIGISRASHLLLTCTGAPVFDDFLALADFAAALCRREGWSRVLIECASVPPAFATDELVRICAYAGCALADKYVALVVADEARFENTRSAAAHGGATLRHFTSNLEAAHWLASVRA
jgi:hypothetical protein